jgi:hypothetical protein
VPAHRPEWFFLVNGPAHELSLANVGRLIDFTWGIRLALKAQGVTGEGAEIDHIELFGPPQAAGGDSKNFVLCPGRAYDRSPCGTGTSRSGAEIRLGVPAGARAVPNQRLRGAGAHLPPQPPSLKGKGEAVHPRRPGPNAEGPSRRPRPPTAGGMLTTET